MAAMKLNYHSIKFQITAAFLMLAVPLLLIAYYNVITHQVFISTLENTSKRDSLLEATLMLQRDVIDLQRNVLIYKKHATASSAEKVESLYASLTEAIANLKSRALMQTYDEAGSLGGISHHLEEYKSNFDVVVNYRQQRAEMVEQHIETGTHRLRSIIEQANTPSLEKAELMAKLASAHAQSIGYLTLSNHRYLNEFNLHIRDIRTRTPELIPDIMSQGLFLSELKDYEKKLSRIVALSRSYIYLINVVMAGSANEIIYHSNDLADRVRSHADMELASTRNSMNQRKLFIFLISVIGFLIAIVVPVYFFRLITKPIQQITTVFNHLAAGKIVSQIPGQNREDEIGHLANAAQVFKSKNEETHLLLQRTEHSFEVQQGLIAELVEAKKRTEKALSIKTDFLANMSHELRTPLNSVIGYTVRILKNPDNLTDRQLNALTTVERNGRHLLSMINDILDLSKLEADKLDVNIQQVDLQQLCQDIIEQMSDAAEEKGIQLLVEKSTNIVNIETDPVRLVQILINLLSNAIKFTDIGWVKLSVSFDDKAQTVTLTVSDTGIGIKQEDVCRLFERYEQLDEASNQPIGYGTGLGLAIVEKLSGLLGGTIHVKSEYGVGSHFSLVIPAQRSYFGSDEVASKLA